MPRLLRPVAACLGQARCMLHLRMVISHAPQHKRHVPLLAIHVPQAIRPAVIHVAIHTGPGAAIRALRAVDLAVTAALP